MSEQIRADFEAYILTERGAEYLAVYFDGGYVDHFVQEAWETWQACYTHYKG